jgi:hypothetical protein
MILIKRVNIYYKKIKSFNYAFLENKIRINLLIVCLNDLVHSYHLNKYQSFKSYIIKQYEQDLQLKEKVKFFKNLFLLFIFFICFLKKQLHVKISSLHDKNYKYLDGGWTIIPIIKQFGLQNLSLNSFITCSKFLRIDNFDFILFCDEDSRVELKSFYENILNKKFAQVIHSNEII